MLQKGMNKDGKLIVCKFYNVKLYYVALLMEKSIFALVFTKQTQKLLFSMVRY